MNLEQRVMQQMKEAMLAKNAVALNAFRAIKSALLLAKTSGKEGAITPQEEILILQKLLKQRQDAASIYKSQGRDDLLQKEEQEMAIINQFLPEQISDEDALKVIKDVIKTTGASGIKDMGKVMGLASKSLMGRIDNKRLSELIKQHLP